MRRFRVLLVALLTLLLVGSCAGPASAAGGVVNHCAAQVKVLVAKKISTGLNLYRLPCGEGTSGVYWATVSNYPFYVKVHGTASICFKAGTYVYPNNSGYERSMVITPVTRC